MVQNIIKLDKQADRVLNIIKAQHGLKNKSKAVEFVLNFYENNFLEPELRPEYLEKLINIKKEGYAKTFNSIKELRKNRILKMHRYRISKHLDRILIRLQKKNKKLLTY